MVESNSATIRSVAWSELFPWLSIVRVFRLAITVRALFLGAVGILLTATGWALIGGLFCPDVQTLAPGDPVKSISWLAPYVKCPWTALTESSPDAAVPCTLPPASNRAPASRLHQNPVVGPWAVLTQPAWWSLWNRNAGVRNAVCLILCGLWGTAVWAFFGAAICRTAAVRLAADEQIGLGATLRFAAKKWPSHFFAPLLPVAGVALAAIPVLVLGWFMKANAGLLLAGIVWPLVIVAGFLMAIFLLGVLFGFPLMWGAISAEGTDSFDALSRSYAYTFQRPLRYLFYIVVAAVLGWLGWIVVQYFAAGVIWLGYWAAGWGCGKEQIDAILVPGGEMTKVGQLGAGMIRFWTGCVKLLAVGYLFSYFWTASTAIYFLLRHDVDATEMDEVFLDADAGEQAASLPPAANNELDPSATNGGTAE
jgi:hypothetical protein